METLIQKIDVTIFLVLELLGPSVEDFFKNKQRFSAKVIYKIGFKMLKIVEKVHNKLIYIGKISLKSRMIFF